jgi:ammonia channel protein AmtB
MVGPVSVAERSAFARKVKAALVAVIGASTGLVALANDASLAGVGIAAVAGLVVGVVLVRVVFPGSGGVD